ncbi:DUF4157 domain-containing protein [Streptomyces sp. HSW2009]|uniref:eCIS core domain-containing protein n=1 Tax=Streptomyces sp. HSW2009 TaxID=3142890 RepID=UPI0032EF8A2F
MRSTDVGRSTADDRGRAQAPRRAGTPHPAPGRAPRQAEPAVRPSALARGVAAAPALLRSVQRTAGNATATQMLHQARATAPDAGPPHHTEQAEPAVRGGADTGEPAVQQQPGRAAVALPAVQRHQHQHPEQQGQATPPPPTVQRSSVADVLRSPGQPLPAALRSEMEQRLGSDFSDVRLHTGSAAQRSAREISARAYTSGHHVVVGAGGADKHTLAHELTHVIQQRQGPVSGTDNGGGLRISDPADHYERAAESNARRVMSRAVPRPSAAPGTDHAHAHTREDAYEGKRRGPGAAGVQRMTRANPPDAGAADDPRKAVEELKERAEKLGRWHANYDAVFDDLLNELPSTFRVDGADDCSDQVATIVAKGAEGFKGTPGQGLPVQILNYVNNGGTSAPGAGGLGSMVIKDRALIGRPAFAPSTMTTRSVAPGQHRRHIIAWHNIRELLNRAYQGHGQTLITYLESKLGDDQVDQDMAQQANTAMGNLPKAAYGKAGEADGRVLMAAAYVMNSSVDNLWVGPGQENTEINRLSRSLQERLAGITPGGLADWRKSLESASYKSPLAKGMRDSVVNRIDTLGTDDGNTLGHVRDFVWKEVIPHLETDEPQGNTATPANQEVVEVGKKVFDAVFNEDQTPNIDVVLDAINVLWTGA